MEWLCPVVRQGLTHTPPFLPHHLRCRTLTLVCLYLECKCSRVKTSTTRVGSKTSKSREGVCSVDCTSGSGWVGHSLALCQHRSFGSVRNNPYLVICVCLRLPACLNFYACVYTLLSYALGSGPNCRWQRRDTVLKRSPSPIVSTA